MYGVKILAESSIFRFVYKLKKRFNCIFCSLNHHAFKFWSYWTFPTIIFIDRWAADLIHGWKYLFKWREIIGFKIVLTEFYCTFTQGRIITVLTWLLLSTSPMSTIQLCFSSGNLRSNFNIFSSIRRQWLTKVSNPFTRNARGFPQGREVDRMAYTWPNTRASNSVLER